MLPAAAAPVLQQPAKLPFGGIGTLPNVPNQARPQDPVDALLQARAAVPLAGPIAGLGNKVRAQPATPQATIPTISPLLADKLSALGAETGRWRESEAGTCRDGYDSVHAAALARHARSL